MNLEPPRGAGRIDVESARQMMDAVAAHAPQADLFIAVAAVADYRPATVAEHKIKKHKTGKQGAQMTGADITLGLVRNPDILATVAAIEEGPFTVGFAAETENTIANARQKLKTKGIDVLAANDVAAGDASGNGVFGGDENAVTLLYKNAKGIGEVELARTDKYRLGVQIIEHIVPLFERRRQAMAGRRSVKTGR